MEAQMKMLSFCVRLTPFPAGLAFKEDSQIFGE